MAKKKKATKQKTSKQNSSSNFFGFDPSKSWISSASIVSKPPTGSEPRTRIYILGNKIERSHFFETIESELHPWQIDLLKNKKEETIWLTSKNGPVALIKLNKRKEQTENEYARLRTLLANVFKRIKRSKFKTIHLSFKQCSNHEIKGALVGLEMCHYSYQVSRYNKDRSEHELIISGIKPTLLESASNIALAVNFSRHLVNLPANDLNPKSFSDMIKLAFDKSPSIKVDIWDSAKLAQENLNLILAVGGGSNKPPCLVRVRYRPSAPKSKKPIAFVGKGITFDSGGLDLKPPQNMRQMKKDMGGAAAVAGLALWVKQEKPKRPCDFYFAIAENSVSSTAYRPGDIFTTRNGLTIEIHNTDAEGRLVLADALQIACDQPEKDTPETIIDIATLTGAMNVALGASVLGFFATDDNLAEKIYQAGKEYGDQGWRMPLIGEYMSLLRSSCADFTNAANVPYAGAITAALFLKKFVKGPKWAHLDIYGWNDSPCGPFSESEASGQGTQCLIGFLDR